MNIITQEAHKRQAAVKKASKKGQIYASLIYRVSLSSVKRWCKQYDGSTWQLLKEKSHKPQTNPNCHTEKEDKRIWKCIHKPQENERFGAVLNGVQHTNNRQTVKGHAPAGRANTQRSPKLVEIGKQTLMNYKFERVKRMKPKITENLIKATPRNAAK